MTPFAIVVLALERPLRAAEDEHDVKLREFALAPMDACKRNPLGP